MKQKIYYSNEQTDDFAVTVKKIKPLPLNYRYCSKSIWSRALSFVLYNLIARPLAWLYMKIKFLHTVKNRKLIKQMKGGCFLFCNHTLVLGDALVPNLLSCRKRNYILTGEQANSLTALLPIMRAVGMIPVTKKLSDEVKMIKCVKERIKENASITVFPEAHIWPYYTGIRKFDETSFMYPIICKAPVFAVTNCYKKRRLFKTPRVVTYIDGPFYPKNDLKRNENASYLRDTVYQAMRERCESESTYSFYEYLKK